MERVAPTGDPGVRGVQKYQSLEPSKRECAAPSWQRLQVSEKLEEANPMARGQKICLPGVTRSHDLCCLQITDPKALAGYITQDSSAQATEANSNHLRRSV